MVRIANGVVVLNASMEPLGIVPLHRALIFLIRERATIVDAVPGRIVRSAEAEFPMPRVVQFREMVRVPYRYVFGLWTESGHARVGRVIRDDGRTVVRHIESSTGTLRSGRCVLDGHVHFTPDEVGEYREIVVDAPTGESPAWLFGDPNASTWVIHIHGMNTDRRNALRTVAAMSPHSDAAHLVVSYRGDGEGPPQAGRATRLGLDEWRDVEAAVAVSVRHGAQRILLAGWCLGATIALLLSEQSAYKDRMFGQILIAPATDWLSLARTSSRRMRLPAPTVVTTLVSRILRGRLPCRLAGLREPIDFPKLDWSSLRTVSIPTLVIHSRGDRTAPFHGSLRFAARNSEHVVLHETLPAAHTREFNVDPEGFAHAIRQWINKL